MLGITENVLEKTQIGITHLPFDYAVVSAAVITVIGLSIAAIMSYSQFTKRNTVEFLITARIKWHDALRHEFSVLSAIILSEGNIYEKDSNKILKKIEKLLLFFNPVNPYELEKDFMLLLRSVKQKFVTSITDKPDTTEKEKENILYKGFMLRLSETLSLILKIEWGKIEKEINNNVKLDDYKEEEESVLKSNEAFIKKFLNPNFKRQGDKK